MEEETRQALLAQAQQRQIKREEIVRFFFLLREGFIGVCFLYTVNALCRTRGVCVCARAC